VQKIITNYLMKKSGCVKCGRTEGSVGLHVIAYPYSGIGKEHGCRRRRTTAEQEWRSSGKHSATKDNINIRKKVSWRQVPMQCLNGKRKKIFPTFYCELRGLNIEDNKATANK